MKLPNPNLSPTSPASSLASVFYRCRSMPEFKQSHARLIVAGLPHLPPSALRPAVSLAALHPSGDVRYAILLVLFSPARHLRSQFLFNTVVRGLARREGVDAVPNSMGLFRRMGEVGVPPNNFTFTFLFQACAGSPIAAELGRQLHSVVVRNSLVADLFVRNSVIQFYSVCGALEDAKRVFHESDLLDVVSWNSLIGGYLRHGDVSEAFVLFDKMPEKNLVSWNSMMSGLVRNDRLEAARFLFDEMPERSIVSWAVMISGYSQSGNPKEALVLFREMQSHHRELSSAVLVGALSATSQLGALEHGKWIHAYIRKNKMPMEDALSTGLISMYANCGSIDLACQVFSDAATEKGISTYTAAIFGLAVSGNGGEALRIFEQMVTEGIEPDGVAYIAVLCACSHMGWVDQGLYYFNEMVSVRGIKAELDHYACMVDLLGRAGFLEEAERFIFKMSIEPDSVIWGALLNACRIHGNAEMGKRVGQLLIELDQCHDGRYVTLSNIYAEFSKGESAEEVRRIMRTRKVKRQPGFSSIELNGVVHEFMAGDRSHDRADDIYLKWEEIVREIKKVGYATETGEVVFDIEEEEKEGVIGYHSEKLAIAFGLMCTDSRTPLRIVKNIRICRDCHSAAKHISLAFQRSIVVRDRKRFHHFEKGSCSCMDYW